MPWLLIPLWFVLFVLLSAWFGLTGSVISIAIIVFLAQLMGEHEEYLNRVKFHPLDIFSRKPKITPRPTEELIGIKGFAMTDLNPSGQVKLKGRTYMAKSGDGSILRSTNVEVSDVVLNTVIVKAID